MASKPLAVLVLAIVAAGILAFMAREVSGHSFYEGCCGGSDCAPLPSRFVTEELGGFRIIMSALESRAINPMSADAVNSFVPMAKVKPSPNGQFHLCIWPLESSRPKDTRVICFWVPLSA